jgi:hypothetical protein
MTIIDDLNYGLAAFGVQIPRRISLSDLAEKLAENPTENTAKVVAISSVLFYLFERGYNPKVQTIWDASAYCATCLSVGYHDIFPRTPMGKMIGTLLMTIGPAISSRTLDGKSEQRRDEIQEQTLATLQQILGKLNNRETV